MMQLQQEMMEHLITNTTKRQQALDLQRHRELKDEWASSDEELKREITRIKKKNKKPNPVVEQMKERQKELDGTSRRAFAYVRVRAHARARARACMFVASILKKATGKRAHRPRHGG